MQPAAAALSAGSTPRAVSVRSHTQHSSTKPSSPEPEAEPPSTCAEHGDEECARISGTVLDATGGPIAGAQLSATGASGEVTRAISDVSGHFALELTPGLAHVSAGADGYSEQARAVTAPLAGVRFVLAPESSIAGRVLAAESGEPVADALVTSVSQDGPEAQPRAVRSGADGTFHLRGLLAGHHSLSAVAERWRGEPVQLSLGVAEALEPVELRVRAATPLRGEVRVAGAPCERGSVFVRGAVRLFAELDAGGSVTFDGVPPGHYTLDVSCQGALPWQEQLELAGEPVERVWELDSGLALHGQALSADGQPLAAAPIEAMPVGEPPGRPGTSCSSDERGAFRCSGVQAGEYDVVIGSGVPARSDSVRVTVTAEAAEGIVLRAHAEGSLRVRLEGAAERELRTLAVVARSAGQQHVGELRDGELVFEHVRLGAYEVALDSGAPGSGQRVELTEPGAVVELTLRLPAARVLSGRVVDESGQGIPDAWVTVAATSDHAQFRPSTPVLSDAEGSFVVPGLLPTRYQLSASHGPRSARLEVEGESQGVLVTVRAPEPAPMASAADAPAP